LYFVAYRFHVIPFGASSSPCILLCPVSYQKASAR
jgi:hypothetical protein